jgi:hypothetical protein
MIWIPLIYVVGIVFLLALVILLWWLTRPKPEPPPLPDGEPNVSNILSLRARYDLATRYLSAWSQQILDEGTQLGYTVTDLFEADATYQKFYDSLVSVNPKFFLGCGHGNETTFTGQNGEEILRACYNDNLMSQRFCYLISCATGSELGPSMVNKTADAYLGFIRDFIFAVEDGYDDNPLEDNYARGFFESAIAPALALLQGKPLTEVYDALISKSNEWLDYWGESSDPNAPTIRTYIIHNRDSFIIATTDGLYRAPVLRLRNTPLFLSGIGILGLIFGKGLK